MGALDGKVAIITGAGQGLGRAHAIHLASEGVAVMVNDVDGANAAAVVSEITDAGGAAASSSVSVSDWEATRALVASTVDLFGDLHLVVNNAGIIRDKMSFSMEEADFDSVVDVHLKGHFCLSRHAGVWWRDQSKAGSTTPRRIVNTTSEAGMFGSAGQANYASAKGGIVSLTWVFARELGRYGVTANVIAPRARTQMTEKMGFIARPQDGSFDRWDPTNVSRVVAWLASDGAADVNGQIFVVFGGDVHHIDPYRVSASISTDHPWEVDELLAAQSKLVGDGPLAPPDPGFVGA